MKPGSKVLCIRAPDAGIPITEGQEYTIKSTFIGAPQGHEAPIEGMSHVPGVTLVEVRGFFRADRFKEITKQ